MCTTRRFVYRRGSFKGTDTPCYVPEEELEEARSTVARLHAEGILNKRGEPPCLALVACAISLRKGGDRLAGVAEWRRGGQSRTSDRDAKRRYGLQPNADVRKRWVEGYLAQLAERDEAELRKFDVMYEEIIEYAVPPWNPWCNEVYDLRPRGRCGDVDRWRDMILEAQQKHGPRIAEIKANLAASRKKEEEWQEQYRLRFDEDAEWEAWLARKAAKEAAILARAEVARAEAAEAVMDAYRLRCHTCQEIVCGVRDTGCVDLYGDKKYRCNACWEQWEEDERFQGRSPSTVWGAGYYSSVLESPAPRHTWRWVDMQGWVRVLGIPEDGEPARENSVGYSWRDVVVTCTPTAPCRESTCSRCVPGSGRRKASDHVKALLAQRVQREGSDDSKK